MSERRKLGRSWKRNLPGTALPCKIRRNPEQRIPQISLSKRISFWGVNWTEGAVSMCFQRTNSASPSPKTDGSPGWVGKKHQNRVAKTSSIGWKSNPQPTPSLPNQITHALRKTHMDYTNTNTEHGSTKKTRFEPSAK